MSIKSQIEMIIGYQNSMNNLVNPNWVNAGYDWKFAALMESCEFADHIGWKWWKKQEPNYQQAFIELVDILHFLLSEFILSKDKNIDELVLSIKSTIAIQNDIIDSKERILAMNSYLQKDLVNSDYDIYQTIGTLVSLVYMIGYNFDDLITHYISKNVLNEFRQHNGYKEGTYIKNWNVEGEVFEDNEIVYSIVSEYLKTKTTIIKEEIYVQIEEAYSEYTS